MTETIKSYLKCDKCDKIIAFIRSKTQIERESFVLCPKCDKEEVLDNGMSRL